ncbi:MAG: histidine phosphatase family protein [Candidatus Caldatribacteriota bacterium]|jgi:broad specificity phosphatase PhoE|nr:histidine phosphatase family protein [Atribacterota bacterium]MDD3031655.1 histidine phosphatase family protein [Atribacterota bacterium]MDD3640496.1 histidine phosphatase family protein [Atribacterota bacterium]MDD4289179.1 histidine phosphatase family protein [Atribacterota bacterium]MDD4765496.1 histidine phosphatase family protein [Atribacterota bacterium]
MKEKLKNKTVIILVRHGECRGNREGLFRGRSDFPLNEVGIMQARELAQEIKQFHPSRIYTSPLTRATQTAEEIKKECKIEVEKREALNNIELGPWEGKSKEYISREYPKEWEIWLKEPEKLSFSNMEPLYSVQKRAREDLDNIIKKHTGECVVIVSHRALLKPLISSCIGICQPYFWRIHLDTASYTIIHHKKEQGFILVQLNQNKHLSEFITEWQ